MTDALLHIETIEDGNVLQKYKLNTKNTSENTYLGGEHVIMFHQESEDGFLRITITGQPHEFKPKTEIDLRVGINYRIKGTHT